MSLATLDDLVDSTQHPLHDDDFRRQARSAVDRDGVLTLPGFLRPQATAALVSEAASLATKAFHSHQTHTVYLETPDPEQPASDARSRAVRSTKGAVPDDLVPPNSGLRTLYDSPTFRGFLSSALGTGPLHRYADPLSSINVNYYEPGQELGWHFDNSEFSVTLLLQGAEGGGTFEFIDRMRNAGLGHNNETEVAAALDGVASRDPATLTQAAGDLVLFRGRDALHRVTPVEGDRTRILVVLAYNTEPGLSLSENARRTFFGRLN